MAECPDHRARQVLAGVPVAVSGGVGEATACALRRAGALTVGQAAAEVTVTPCPPNDTANAVTVVATAGALHAPLTVGAVDMGLANRVLTVLADDAGGASWPADVRLAAPVAPTLGVTHPVSAAVLAALSRIGARLVAVDTGAAPAPSSALDAVVTAGPPTELEGGCAVSLAARPDRPALTVLARPFDDAVAWDIAAAIDDQPEIVDVWPLAGAEAVELVVFGAHLRGGPLSHQLTDRGARWAGEMVTAPRYRMTVLPTSPPKPAVTRLADGEPGAPLRGERWMMSAAALGRFLAALPAPMQLGKVEFDDGSWRTAFGCDHSAATGREISSYGSWPAALAAGVTEAGGVDRETGRP